LPLVLTHGWPDSFWRYTKVIPLLTDPAAHGADPADAFDVIVPDIPGFGYSDSPVGPLLDAIDVAGLWELMTILGYPRFGAAGGDIGGHVSRYLGLDHPDRIVAVHRTDAGTAVHTGDLADLAPEERAMFETAATWAGAEGAYIAMHRTKPQTAAFGLTDSPPGWPLGSSRSSAPGAITTVMSSGPSPRTRSSPTSPSTGSPARSAPRCACTAPTARSRPPSMPAGSRCHPASLFAGDISHPPRAWLERYANVVRLTEPPRGGHFAAFEEPELYAEELRSFFRPYRAMP
jgi:pimeloyl-ACP methyl ester carboxylesterase